MGSFQENEQRREEWEALVEESLKSLLRCYKCPVWGLCAHQEVELSETLEFRRPLPNPRPSDSMIASYKEELKVMEDVKKKCPLLTGCDHHFSKGD